jgi:hypothetical protein
MEADPTGKVTIENTRKRARYKTEIKGEHKNRNNPFSIQYHALPLCRARIMLALQPTKTQNNNSDKRRKERARERETECETNEVIFRIVERNKEKERVLLLA